MVLDYTVVCHCLIVCCTGDFAKLTSAKLLDFMAISL